MHPDTAMTGTFQANLPTDLLSAIERHDVKGPGKDLTVRSMKPTLGERLVALFSKKPAKRR